MELTFPPGIVKTDSGSAATGRYIDSSWIRFSKIFPEKIGGYTRFMDDTMVGVPRAMHTYNDPNGLQVVGAGTEQKLYVITQSGTISDITPFRSSVTLTDPFATTISSAVVTVADTAHGAISGAVARFDGASAVGGITIDGEYILTKVNDDSYTITHSSAATSAGASGGGSVDVDYEINPGPVSATLGIGYGVGPYGAEAYGTERTLSGITLDPRFWSLDNYGDNLLAAYQGGTVYLYDSDAMDRAEPLSGAPTDVVFAFVTEERYVFALCADLRLDWPDQDDPTDWTPVDTNTANSRRLGSGSKFIAGTVLGGGISLIWTDTSLYLFQFTGGSFVYADRMIAEHAGLVGPGAFVTVDGLAFWMSNSGFHMYNGGVVPLPNSDDVDGWVFRNIAIRQRAKITCYYNASFREVWWIWPSTDSLEPDTYVAVNIDDFTWINGSLSRVGATNIQGSLPGPLLSSADGRIYRHEDGLNADGEALDWHLESGELRMQGATNTLDVFGYRPDAERQVGTITLTLTCKDSPFSTTVDSQTVDIETTSLMVDTRVSGRYVRHRLSQTGVVDGDYRGGISMLDTQTAGARR